MHICLKIIFQYVSRSAKPERTHVHDCSSTGKDHCTITFTFSYPPPSPSFQRSSHNLYQLTHLPPCSASSISITLPMALKSQTKTQKDPPPLRLLLYFIFHITKPLSPPPPRSSLFFDIFFLRNF